MNRTVFAILICCTMTYPQSRNPDLRASLAEVPGLAETPDRGAFVEIVKAMDKVYPGHIIISVWPYARSFNNLLNGEADFHIPAMRNPAIPPSALPYRYASEKIGSVCMVLYSNLHKPVTPRDILDAMAKEGAFPYVIEVSAGAEKNCPFPVVASINVESSLRKVALGRIDAFWKGQEETDLILQQLKLPTIVRYNWGEFDDVIVVQKSDHGCMIDSIISPLLRVLRRNGTLDSLYSKVHKPFDDWQPAKMGW